MQKKSMSISDLSILADGDGYALYACGKVLRTGRGNPIRHQSKELLRNIVLEFRGKGPITVANGLLMSPMFFGSYSMVAIMLDCVAHGKDEPTLGMEACMLSDPMLYEIPGPAQAERDASFAPVRQWLGNDLSVLRDHASVMESLAFVMDEEEDQRTPRDSRLDRVISDVESLYGGMTLEQRTVVTFLRNIHQHCFLMAMSLVLDPDCSESEYADGIVGALMLHSHNFTDVSAREDRRGRYRYERDARAALRFLAAARVN